MDLAEINDPVETNETIRKRIAVYEAIGVQELMVMFPDAHQLDSMRRFASTFIA